MQKKRGKEELHVSEKWAIAEQFWGNFSQIVRTEIQKRENKQRKRKGRKDIKSLKSFEVLECLRRKRSKVVGMDIT